MLPDGTIGLTTIFSRRTVISVYPSSTLCFADDKQPQVSLNVKCVWQFGNFVTSRDSESVQVVAVRPIDIGAPMQCVHAAPSTLDRGRDFQQFRVRSP